MTFVIKGNIFVSLMSSCSTVSSSCWLRLKPSSLYLHCILGVWKLLSNLLKSLAASSLSVGSSHLKDFRIQNLSGLSCGTNLICFHFGLQAKTQLELRVLQRLVGDQQHTDPWTLVGEILCFPLYVEGHVSNVNMVLKCTKSSHSMLGKWSCNETKVFYTDFLCGYE